MIAHSHNITLIAYHVEQLFLHTADGPRYVSMIANGSYAPNSVMGQILLASQRISRCPAWTAAVTLPAEPD